MVGSLSEGSSRWCGPAGGGKFERGDQQVVRNLSEGTSR